MKTELFLIRDWFVKDNKKIYLSCNPPNMTYEIISKHIISPYGFDATTIEGLKISLFVYGDIIYDYQKFLRSNIGTQLCHEKRTSYKKFLGIPYGTKTIFIPKLILRLV